jgi:glycosyltransferase involved in cell wall biosynthesis
MTINILCIVTSPNDETRARKLTFGMSANVTYCNVDKSVSRYHSILEVWKVLNSQKWDLVYLEGTGLAGGVNVIRSHFGWKQRYIVSSGDPISGYFEVTAGLPLAFISGLYERLLYSTCSGFIGWTPYLTGMALKLGARRAVTIASVDLERFHPYEAIDRESARSRFGIKPGQLVLGVVGSLNWRKQSSYCYGLELIASLKLISRQDVTVLIVGDGSGLKLLQNLVPDNLRSKVIFTGKLGAGDVVASINAMDIGFVTQFPNNLGNYRLTTKLPEYLACGVPVAMTPVPGFFDFAAPAGWALPPGLPTSELFHNKCARWITKLSRDDINAKASRAREIAIKHFDDEIACQKFHDFTTFILSDEEIIST